MRTGAGAGEAAKKENPDKKVSHTPMHTKTLGLHQLF
jgi:hypothetical protein